MGDDLSLPRSDRLHGRSDTAQPRECRSLLVLVLVLLLVLVASSCLAQVWAEERNRRLRLSAVSF